MTFIDLLPTLEAGTKVHCLVAAGREPLRRQGERLLVILDDASRLIVGYARTRRASAELAWDTFQMAGERYGFPRQVLTDHGTQFTKIQYESEGRFDAKPGELRKGGRGVQV